MAKKGYRDEYTAAHISNTVAAQIAALRTARGWTQTDLAKKVGMKQPRISALEDPNNENFEAKTLLRLASAFDVGLSIRFVPFSQIVQQAAQTSDETILVHDFPHDRIGNMQPTGSSGASIFSVAKSPEVHAFDMQRFTIMHSIASWPAGSQLLNCDASLPHMSPAITPTSTNPAELAITTR